MVHCLVGGGLLFRSKGLDRVLQGSGTIFSIERQQQQQQQTKTSY